MPISQDNIWQGNYKWEDFKWAVWRPHMTNAVEIQSEQTKIPHWHYGST